MAHVGSTGERSPEQFTRLRRTVDSIKGKRLERALNAGFDRLIAVAALGAAVMTLSLPAFGWPILFSLTYTQFTAVFGVSGIAVVLAGLLNEANIYLHRR